MIDIPNNFPSLPQAVMNNARLFADRTDLIKSITDEAIVDVAEIGVALGDFSEFLIHTLKPQRFVAFDTFEMHLWPEHWGRTSDEIFGGFSHRQYVERRLGQNPVDVVIDQGDSSIRLANWEDGSFDLIYVDARHDYEGVKADTFQAARVLRAGGHLIFNDYTIYDPYLKQPYGVIPCVNELVNGGGWEVIGFSLQRHMFCDIALRKLEH